MQLLSTNCAHGFCSAQDVQIKLRPIAMWLSAQVAQPRATASNGSAAQQPGAAWPALAAALAAVLAATARHLPADWLADDTLRSAAAEAAAMAVSLAAPRRAQRDGGDPVPVALSGRPEADRDHLVQVRTVKLIVL